MTSSNSEGLTSHRARIADVASEPRTKLPPIEGFENCPLVSVEQSVDRLVDKVTDVKKYAAIAKRQAMQNPSNDGLTVDESAAIRLYTMEWKERNVYKVMNEALRSEKRDDLKPWFYYLRLLFHALLKLPPVSCNAYRGVKRTLYQDYVGRKDIIWWQFSSCARSIHVLENEAFFGKEGARTLFLIKCSDARDVKAYSDFPGEQEVLVLPGTQFKIEGHLDSGNGVHVITLEETKSAIYLPVKRMETNRQTLIPVSQPTPKALIVRQPTPKQHPAPQQITNPLHYNQSTESPPLSNQPTARREVRPISSEQRKRMNDVINSSKPGNVVEFKRLQLTDEEVPDIVDKVIVNKRCTRLVLNDSNIRVNGIAGLAKAASQSNTLEELNLSRDQLNDEDIQPLTDELVIEGTPNEPSCPCLPCFSSSHKELRVGGALKVLNLAENNIGDRGAEYLSNLITYRPTLIELRLSKNQITNRGVKKLVNALSDPNARLKRLYLDENPQITAESIDDLTRLLKRNTTLEILWLTGCGFTRNARDDLEKVADSKKNFSLRIDAK